MKLTRATIPMCPECGAELDDSRSMWDWDCECGAELYHAHAHWGYYAPDVDGVAAELRNVASRWYDGYMHVASVIALLRDLANRLSPERKDGEG